MMKKNLFPIPLFCSVLAFAMLLLSCKKVVNIELKDAASMLVIEGNVANNTNRQTVKLSRSAAITDSNNFPAVSGATVTITAGNGRIYNLAEQTAGTYVTTAFRGQSGQSYQLNVTTGGTTYAATSAMPAAVKLDSLGLNAVTILSKSFLYPEVYYLDPIGVANYYHFVLYVNNVQSANTFAYNDDLTDGRSVERQLRDNNVDLKSGDRILVEMQCTDKNIYTYWNGLSQNQNRGGASTTPANPQSNISNGALGYFSAHTVQQGSFIVP